MAYVYYQANASTSTGSYIWPMWMDQHGTTSTIWTTWSSNTSTALNYIHPGQWQQMPNRAPTDEEVRADQQRAEAALQEREKEQAARVVAKKRARELLEALLDPEQHKELLEQRCFRVKGESGKQYRIRTGGVSGNIEVLDDGGKTTHRLCCHLGDYSIPDEDHFVAQMLMLRHNEENFVRTANRRGALE